MGAEQPEWIAVLAADERVEIGGEGHWSRL
jgi:hypothetical protein